jgi:hypothetical protein
VAFLSAYRGCLGRNEHRHSVPFLLEILLRADCYVEPFVHAVQFLDPNEHAQDLDDLLRSQRTRELVVESLECTHAKFPELERVVAKVLAWLRQVRSLGVAAGERARHVDEGWWRPMRRDIKLRNACGGDGCS